MRKVCILYPASTSLPPSPANVSFLQEVDDSFTRQYSGVLTTVHENPEMGSDSPVEICERDPRIWEVGGGTVKYGRVKTAQEKDAESRVGSLYFCRDLRVWMPKK